MFMVISGIYFHFLYIRNPARETANHTRKADNSSPKFRAPAANLQPY